MAKDTAYTTCDGVLYAVNGHVDDNEKEIIEVSVWLYPPIPASSPLVERFIPKDAHTKRQLTALDALQALYGISPVLLEE